MKKNINNKLILVAAGIALLGAGGCTNLDEKLYNQLDKGNFYRNKTEVMQSVLRSYRHMMPTIGLWAGNNWFYLAELSADQLAWPRKGRHGEDGGDHYRLHYHTWTASENTVRNGWSEFWTGVGYANATLEDLEKMDHRAIGLSDAEKAELVAELRVLRAYYYLKIMQLWGNVPIVTEVQVAAPLNPPTKPRSEVFAFVRTELETAVPQLPRYAPALVGRATQTAGYAMLAELYLNAEYLAGTAMWDECIDACDKIINGDAGSLVGNAPVLATDLLETFSNTNQNAGEALFQSALSRKGGFGWTWEALFGYGENIGKVLDVGYSGWNGIVVVPSAFDAFETGKDRRKTEWFLFGPQYEYGTTTPVLGTEEWNEQPLIYVNTIRRESEGDLTSEGGMSQGEENSGARFNKYKSGRLSDPNYFENHYMFYRLTEIYFNKAEAIMRKNGGTATQEAVDLVNASRVRAFTNSTDWDIDPNAQYTTATLTMDELLAERGREFIFEGKRRTDLIRFGKFSTTDWWDHKAHNDPNKEVFPIPETQTRTNPNLVQNPGY